jgi:perosamine synthetase
MITTSDGKMAERLRHLRHHGMSITDLDRHKANGRYLRESYVEVGYNYRMTDLQAAVGLVQLGRMGEMLTRRRALAARYDAELEGVDCPYVPTECEPNYQSYVVRLRGGGRTRRDQMIDELLKEGITTRPGVMASHREPPYVDGKWQLPVTEQVSDETLMIPLYHQMTEAEQERVIRALNAAARA